MTGYQLDAFGAVLQLTRYGTGTQLAARSVTQSSHAASRMEVETLLAGTSFSHASDRVLQNSYDRLGRLVETQQPEAFFYDQGVSSQGFLASTRTRNTWNAFGDLVRVSQSRDQTGASWCHTTHYFDRVGQEIATVDALGYLTVRAFDRFGNVAALTEYATALPAGSWSTDGHGAPPASDADRATEYRHDVLNRKSQEIRRNVEYSAAADGTRIRGDLTTAFGYDALGNQTSETDALGQVKWIYYDALGRVRAIATPFSGATKTLTVLQRDAHGNETVKLEYATPVSPTAAGFEPPPSTATDRKTITRFDALGRALEVQDANGNVVFSSYDAHGNVAKTWRAVTDADNRTLTQFQVNVYDATGHLVETRTPASTTVVQGGVKATYTPRIGNRAFTDPNRLVLEWSDIIDAFGGSVRVEVDYMASSTLETDLEGTVIAGQPAHIVTIANELSAPAAAGGTEFTWAESTDSIVYIRVRQVVGGVWQAKWEGTLANAAGSGVNVLTQAQAGLVYATQEFNAFGEITRRGSQGGRQEYFDYDGAGNLWRTNSGDGVDKVFLHDLRGNVTSEIRSAGSGGINQDVKAYANAQAAAQDPNSRRVDTQYDALGRVTAKTEAARVQEQGGVSFQRQFVTASFQSAVPISVPITDGTTTLGWEGQNQVTLGWNSLATLGSGDLIVTVEYKTPRIQVDGQFVGGQTRTYQSALLNGDVHATGVMLAWNENASTVEAGGIGVITRVTVSKRQAAQGWKTVIDQAPGYGANELLIGTPADPQTLVKLEVRRVGASEWIVPAGELVEFGAVYRYDTTFLGAGNFDYKVTGRNALEEPVAQEQGSWVIASGTVAITLPPLSPITTPLSFGVAYTRGLLRNPAVLSWAQQDAAMGQAFRYRAAGTNAAWSTLAIEPFNGDSLDGVNCSALAAGTYEFELIWSAPGQGTPTHHATGTFTVVPEQPSYWVPPSGTPNITGLYLDTMEVTYTVIVFGKPRTATKIVPALYWDACNADVARAYNGTWVGLAIDNSLQATNLQGRLIGQQRASLEALGGGTWSLEVHATDPSAPRLATATYAVNSNGERSLWVTTPPYTPGYWTEPVPKQYSVSVTTSASSSAVSTMDGALLSQLAAQSAGNRWLRPTVLQNTDRWGNVVSISDPRSANWVTTYRFDANDRMVRQAQPETAELGARVTEIYYDALGRQVAVRDANGNLNGQAFDAAGHLLQELHADTGIVTHSYDALGRRTRTVDEEGHAVGFTYDAMGNLLAVDKGQLPTYVNVGNGVQWQGLVNIKDTWTYDELGRKINHANGNGETLTYAYDLRGNVVETRQPLGQRTRSAYDAQGRKTAEVDANGFAIYWTYDYFGQLTDHIDLGGARYAYTYDNARQLLKQANTRTQTLQYEYDQAGQLTRITDVALNQVSSYMYDQSGRRIRERVVQQGVTYQDNHLAYDEVGNLRRVSDARADIRINYDRAGNRTFVGSYVDYLGVNGTTQTSQEGRYFLYDQMNRQTVVDAYSAAGDIGPDRGHVITYYKNGNRESDRAWRESVRSTTGASPIVSISSTDGAAVQDTALTYVKGKFESLEFYRYDAANRLQSIVRDGVMVDHRRYDGADRLLFSGPADLPPNYVAVARTGVQEGRTDGLERTYNRYDKNGRILHQNIFNSDGSARSEISWDPGETGTPLIADGYDAVGNVKGYVIRDVKSGAVSEYSTEFKRFEGHQAFITEGRSTVTGSGTITQGYDPNGYLVSVRDSTYSASDRTFVNDASGRALFVNQGGNVQRQLIVNGEVLGIYGVGIDARQPRTEQNNPNFVNLVDFDFGYAPITNAYPNAAPGTYVVQTGDTLQSIAQSAYGDSALWYRIAEANGVMTSTDLKVGQTLNIPNRVSTIHNNESTFKPYDPSRITGDLTPNLPAPKGGCGGAGQLLMVIVAIVVTIFTAGAATGVIANALATGAAAGGASMGALSAMATLYTVAGYAVAGAAGSIASQLVGRAVGAIDKFSWKSVGQSALLTAVSAGVGSYLSDVSTAVAGVGAEGTAGAGATSMAGGGAALRTEIAGTVPASGHAAMTSKALAVIGRAVVSNMVAQGIGVTVGLQRKFDWRAVAASGAGAVMGHVVGEGSKTLFKDWGQAGQVLRGTMSGLAGGSVAAAVRGGRVVVQQIAVDAFGNAVGQSIAEAAASRDPMGDFINEKLRDQERRDSYGLTSGIDSVRLRAGGRYGLQLSDRAAATWKMETGAGVAAAARTLDGGDVDGWSLIQTAAGAARIPPSQGGYRPGSLLELFRRGPSHEIARNQGREAVMSGIDDMTGFVGLMGDYRVIGNALQLGAQVDKNKAEMEFIRKDLIALGKRPPMGEMDVYAPGDGARVLADKLGEHRNYVRLTLFERAGVLTLNDDFSIRTIGKDQLSPLEFTRQLRGVYEVAVAQGSDIADARLREGKLFVNHIKFGDSAEIIAKGNFVDSFGKGAVRTWLDIQGVPEGPYGLVSINRRFTDTGNIDDYRMPDVVVNWGPRAVLALDATLGAKTASTPQVRDSLRFGVTDWVNVTPAGSQWIKNPSVAPTYRWRLR